MKKIFSLKRLLIASVAAVSVFTAVPAMAAESLYEQVTDEVLAKGINYTLKHRLTKEGWLDIYVLTADLSNPNIDVEPVDSKKELGLRETVDKLISENSAVAGVNSAYFGMTSKYSASFGPEISTGNIVSVDTDKNIDKNQFGTYFVNKDGSKMFDYFKTKMVFNVEGKDYFEFASINKITQMVYPVYLDKNACENTAQLDSRFQNLVKLKVEDDHITYISQKGETVNVPDNGYLVVLSSEYANAYMPYLAVGQSVKVNITSSFDLNNIETAISGGGVILKDGAKPADIGEMASGRQPRTLLGLSQDKNTLKLIVVDGKRSNGNNVSIGANVDEAIQILKDEGCYYGLNLDGGGSSTMAVKDPSTSSVSIVNSPAEGTARSVMTAVGIFDKSTVGGVSSIKVTPSSTAAVPGGHITFTVDGYDDNLHKLALNKDQIQYSSDDNSGLFNGGVYTYGAAENTTITVTYNGVSQTCKLNLDDITSISPENSELSLNAGESRTLKVNAHTSSGQTVDITNMVQFDTTFGTLSGNTYTANENGSGYITCSYGQNTCYIKVGVGTEDRQISSFENTGDLTFTSYPATIQGIAGISQKYFTDGAKGLGLSYYFASSSETQAAYLNFKNPVAISGTPSKLKLKVYGNGTEQWVRAKIADSKGNESVVDFSREKVINEGWNDLTADIPSGISYPITLKTIYVAALSNTNTNQQVMYFDDLRGVYSVAANVQTPVAQSSADSSFASKEDGYYYINITGGVSSSNVKDSSLYDSERRKIHSLLQANADTAIYGGNSDISFGDSTEVIRWKNDYAVYYKNDVTFVNMTAAKGGLKNTYDGQWQRFKNDILMSPNKFVVVLLDKSPSNFSDSMEGELFKSALKDIENADREVMVVSSSSTASWTSVKDGIQYFNLPSLWLNDGSVNSDFKMLKLRIGNGKISYQLCNLE